MDPQAQQNAEQILVEWLVAGGADRSEAEQAAPHLVAEAAKQQGHTS